jgi:FkbH-like protein
MRETADIAKRSQAINLPEGVRDQFLETAGALKARSTIIWGEHCTECAFPSCYSSCAFYSPREDYHCRRFVNGIEALKITGSSKLTLSRIQFKRWGKLEGRGPAALKSAATATALEHLDRAIHVSLKGPFSRRVVDQVVRRLNRAKNRLATSGRPLGADDIFLMETWHEGSRDIPFTFTIVPNDPSAGALFQHAVSVVPGYSRTIIPVKEMTQRVDLTQPFRVQIEPLVESTPAIVFGVTDFARPARSLQSSKTQAEPKRPKIKCVVWDLDNVVWNGTLIEDGLEGLSINPLAVSAIVELDRRGILNSIASKNDPEPAIRALKHFGLFDYFVFPQISWKPKSDSLAQIASSLDISLDTFAFVDDQPFERGEIATLCPDVQVIADTEISAMLGLPRFDVPVTVEGTRRRQMYKVEEHRQHELSQSTLSYDEFLASSRIRLEVSPLRPETALRVYELSQRTNQLNISGRRYTRDEIDELIKVSERTYVLRCSDRFGDYGIIGFCVVSPAHTLVESFFMSCRVQRKRVENAFFTLLASETAAAGQETLRVLHRRTAKNQTAAAMLTELGFEYCASDEIQGEFRRPVSKEFEHGDVVKLATVEHVAA